MLDIEQVAEELNVPESYLRQRVEAGAVASVRIGDFGLRMIPED